jgi:hypothetical protein
MKLRILLFGLLFSAHALADSSVPIIPLNQKLSVVDYSSDGRQTGCGLRATGETKDNLMLNVLVTVFRKDTGATFGVIKVVARKQLMKDGVPELQDGRPVIADLGKIQHAWVKPDSGKQPMMDKSAQSSHSDAYMVNTEFSGTVDLLVEMSQLNFKVGLNRIDEGPDEVFQFNQHLGQDEAGKLSACMNNLRAAIEENKRKESF